VSQVEEVDTVDLSVSNGQEFFERFKRCLRYFVSILDLHKLTEGHCTNSVLAADYINGYGRRELMEAS